MGTVGLALRTALAPAMWGTTYLVTTQFLPADHPMWIALLRALPAGLVLLALRPAIPGRGWLWRSLVLGTLNIGAFFALLFVAATRLPGGVAATLGATQIVFVLLLAAALLGERITAAKAGAALTGVVGVALLVLRGSAALDLVGVLAGIGTALCIALGMVLTRRWGRPRNRAGDTVHALTATAWQLLGGSVVLLPLALGTEGAPPALDAVALGGFAWLTLISTALGYVLFFAGVHRLQASATALLGLASPVVATVLGWAVLDQSLTPAQLAGMALVLGSVVFGQYAARPSTPATPAVPRVPTVSDVHSGPVRTGLTHHRFRTRVALETPAGKAHPGSRVGSP